MTNELVARAVFLQRQGSLDEAEQLYRRVLRELPDHAGVLEALGVLSFGRGQVEEAADLFRRGVASRPNSALMRRTSGKPFVFWVDARRPSINYVRPWGSILVSRRPGTVSACWRTIRGAMPIPKRLAARPSGFDRGSRPPTSIWATRSGHSTGGPRLPWPSARLLCSSPTIPLPLRISVRT